MKAFADKKSAAVSEQAEYRRIIDEAKQVLLEYRNTHARFDSALDPEIVEACVYELKALQARYAYLMKLARRLEEDKKVEPVVFTSRGAAG